jgi:hypothetical protein
MARGLEALQRLANLPTKTVDATTGRNLRVGELPASSLSPAAVDLIYKALRKERTVTRQANYTIDVARKAWRVVARQHPGQFMVPVDTAQGRSLALNPFQGLERVRGRGTTIPASCEHAWALARALTEIGHAALGAAALIAYEWHQRPENIVAGHLAWTDYRPSERSREVRIFHHKRQLQNCPSALNYCPEWRIARRPRPLSVGCFHHESPDRIGRGHASTRLSIKYMGSHSSCAFPLARRGTRATDRDAQASHHRTGDGLPRSVCADLVRLAWAAP